MRQLLIVLALAACGDKDDTGGVDCTAIGCVDGLELGFSPSLTSQGEIEVVVEIDGSAESCRATLPLDSNTPSDCDSSDIYLYTSGSALSEDQHEITGLYITTSPASVSVSVWRDGEEVGQAELSPTYEVLQPNGPECEPTCEYASGSVAIDSP